MSVALDSNILIDVLGASTEFTPHAVEALNAALTRGGKPGGVFTRVCAARGRSAR